MRRSGRVLAGNFMERVSLRRVAQPPAKPLMIFDRDCHFCTAWIERWRDSTGDAVDYEPSQEVRDRFPEIAPAEYERAVYLVEPDGRISRGAEAVARSLRQGGRKFPLWAYELLPGPAEAAYALVARNRGLASFFSRALWGAEVRRPTYGITRNVFLRALGLVFLVAFVSLWVQIDGLVGSGGISPVEPFLQQAREQVGARATWLLPTLCWLNASDFFLQFLCGTGVLFSLLLIAGLLPAISLAILYGSYLSLTIAGQEFLSFQWDILLLETGFLAIFFAPWSWRLRRAAPVPPAGLFLLKLLLWKLMFLSGVVKLTSGDLSWWDLSSLDFHYETQPLPTVLAWFAHQGPAWLRQFGVGFALAVELVAPFFLWAPRRLRLGACGLLVVFQIAIALTGNYAFFNLLTVVLCLLLIDDSLWARWLRRARPERIPRARILSPALVVLLVTLPLNAGLTWSALRPEWSWPKPLAAVRARVAPFMAVNGYGLFRVMTRTRPEIILEGSADGIDWQPYRFRWKPGPLERAPRWVQPHQPRLDWQMWFAALGGPQGNPWFYGLVQRLLEGSPSVTGLLEENPFAERPPRYVRAILYRYRFTTAEERRATGNWWKREELREYLRPVSLAP